MKLFNKKSIIIIVFIVLIFMYFQTFVFTDDTATNNIIRQNEEKVFSIKDISNFKNKIATANEIILPPNGDLFGYGMRLFNTNGEFISNRYIQYMDTPLEYFVSIANINNYDDDIGFMILYDDELQPFYIDEQEQKYVFYKFNLKKKSQINLPITFDPEIKNKNMIYNIHFFIVYYLNEDPGEKYKYIDFFTLSLPYKIDFSNSKKTIKNNNVINKHGNTMPITDSIKKLLNVNYITTIITKNKEKNNLTQEITITSKKGAIENFLLKSAGKKGKYSTIVFLNNEPLPIFNNKYNLDWEINNNEMLNHEFKMQIPNKNGIYSMYTITIPVESDLPYPVGSSKFLLNVVE
ncbi:MAG: hypothetical protein FIA99_18105 [Ruminiclostridium sp.]|nr:hypothetical protein [Ruminiclostridium sp.]